MYFFSRGASMHEFKLIKLINFEYGIINNNNNMLREISQNKNMK